MRWLMLSILFIVRLAMGYQFQSVASISAPLVADFGFSYVQVGTLIGFFLLPGVFMAMPSGAMTRAASDKTLLMIGAAVMAGGSAAMAMAETPMHLYGGRLLTGVGGTIFSLVLTKMVTEWFAGKEIITALSVMLVSWPIGIALGLLTQGPVASAFGWSAVLAVCTVVSLSALVLTAVAYRAPPVNSDARSGSSGPLRFGLPAREAVHTSVAGVSWASFNASIILLVSFGPDSLVARGWALEDSRFAASLMMWATMISLPLGGRLMERFGHVTVGIAVCLLIAAGATYFLFMGQAPAAMFVLFGLAAGVPGGALLALSSEAVSPANRGPGLGIFYTWYYLGMTLAPVGAGWLRDTVQHAGAPVLFAGGLLVAAVSSVLLQRCLQAFWPLQGVTAARS
jgi:MFS family permease